MNIKEKQLLCKIEEIVKEYPMYGYRKVYAILRYRYGYKVYRNKVYKLMKENKLLLPASTNNKKLFKGIPFSYKLDAQKSSELWGVDMTYIWCGQDGWGYLHAVIDHYDKTILGYNFSLSCKAIGAVMALSEAASKRPVNSLELRSDNGCHYGARLFRDEIRRLGIRHTRTMVNTPKGNAVIERFFRSIKQECVWLNRFEDFNHAKDAIEHWIEEYNNKRPHQSLGYMSPEEYYRENLRKSA